MKNKINSIKDKITNMIMV